jgi:hypothetical protein
MYSAFHTAEANLARASVRVETADADLSKYTELDQRITGWRVEQVKTNRDDPLPHDLMLAQANRGQVADAAQSAHRAYDHLHIELQKANGQLEQAKLNRDRGALAVLVGRVNSLATEIHDARDTIIEARRKLVSIGATWVLVGAQSAPLPLSQIAKDALNSTIEQPGSKPSYQQIVRDWFADLIMYSDSEIGGWQ